MSQKHFASFRVNGEAEQTPFKVAELKIAELVHLVLYSVGKIRISRRTQFCFDAEEREHSWFIVELVTLKFQKSKALVPKLCHQREIYITANYV